MGYTVIGYPSRAHKRKKHVRQCHILPSDDQLARHTASPSVGVQEVERPTSPLKRPRSLQDLPVEIIQRIFVLTQDANLMRSLNTYFNHNLQLTDSLLHEMYKTYMYDPVADGFIPRSSCPEYNSIILSTALFHNEAVMSYLERNNSLLCKVWTYLDEELIDHKYSRPETKASIQRSLQLAKDGTLGDFPRSFYKKFGRYLTLQSLMHHLSHHYVLYEPFRFMEDFFRWVFTTFTSVVKDYGDILDVLNTVYEIGRRFIPETYEGSSPLVTLIELLLESDRPLEVQTYADKLALNSKDSDSPFIEKSKLRGRVDSRVLIIEQVVQFYYTKEHIYPCLSDYDLWSTIRRINNMKLIEVIEKYGGQPQYSLFT